MKHMLSRYLTQWRLVVLGAVFALILVACGSPAPTAETAAPSTPTPGITPTPTIPAVPSRLVHFSTPDNVRLGGLLYGQGKTAVICSHMLGTDKSIWPDSGIPQRLALGGYLVLAYDFRGYGDSVGVKNSTVFNDADLRAAITFMRQQGATKIVLLGASMGGTASLIVASSLPVDAVITLSAPQNFIPGVTDDQVKAIRAPKLFVNSQQDDYASETQHMYDIASQPKTLKMYPGYAHGTAIFDDNGVDLTQRILAFVAQYAPAS